MTAAWRELPDGSLIDRIGATQLEIKRLESLKEAMAQELFERGCLPKSGTAFRAHKVSETVTWTVDRKKLEGEFGERWMQKYLKHGLRKAYIQVLPLAAALRALEAAE